MTSHTQSHNRNLFTQSSFLSRSLLLLTASAVAFITPNSLATVQSEESKPYSRVIDQDDGKVTLEMCNRTFAPVNGEGPRIHLVSAIHIADKQYYQAMQEMLDAYDTVLFEGVKPAGLDPLDEHATDEQRIEATNQRLSLLISAVDMYHAETGKAPQSVTDLLNNANTQIASFVKGAIKDGWNNRFVFRYRQTTNDESSETIIEFVSYGADQDPGGTGHDADISLESRPYTPTTKAAEAPEGIQTQLATALNVSFQLDEMDTSKDHWVNADIDIVELNRQLAEYGDDGMMLEMIQGDTLQTKIMGFIVGFISKSPQLSSIMKIVMMDILAAAESSDVMDQFGAIGEVILEGRNQVVVESIQHQLDTNPNQNDIGVFYGAAHMKGIEESLVEMGYTHESDIWTQAMVVDINTLGMPEQTVNMMRNMVRNSLEQSFETLKQLESEE